MASSLENLTNFGPFHLDLGRQVLYRDGKVVELRPHVFKVLKCFYEHRNKLITHKELDECAWGRNNQVKDKTRTQTVKDLKDALEEYGELIETRHALGYVFNIARFSPHPELFDARWLQLLDSLERHKTYRVTECAWVYRFPNLEIHDIDLEYHSAHGPFGAAISAPVRSILDSYHHPSPSKDAQMRRESHGTQVRLEEFASEHDSTKFVFHLAPTKFLYYAATHGRLSDPELNELREQTFTNTVREFPQEVALLLPSQFAIHMGVITRDGYALLRQRRPNTELFTSAWEAGLGEFMHGPKYRGRFKHFYHGKPTLELFLKNAVAEELGYYKAKPRDFTIHGFAIEYQSLAPKLLVLYTSDADIEVLCDGAKKKWMKKRRSGGKVRTDWAQDAKPVKLSPRAIADALKQSDTWGPTSRLILMIALEHTATSTKKGVARVEELNRLLESNEVKSLAT